MGASRTRDVGYWHIADNRAAPAFVRYWRWSQLIDATLYLRGKRWSVTMGQRFRRGFTATAKTELWERWQRGESLKAIGRAFGKPSSSIYFQVAPHGGIRPASRRRSRLALRLAEREEISRGIAGARSMRSMARLLRRARSRSPAQAAATRPPSSYSAFFWPGR